MRPRKGRLRTLCRGGGPQCILSAGIFCGACPLSVVNMKTGLDAIAKHAYSGLETVVFCGFTHQEQMTIRNLVEQGL